jgi:hypothetical protein
MKNILLIYRAQVFDSELKPRLYEYKNDNIILVVEDEINKYLVQYLIEDLNQNITLVTSNDFLDDNIITKFMKFDVAVGNPPYESDNNKGNKKWIPFTKKVLELSDNVSFIVPTSLMTSESQSIVEIRTILNKRENIFDLTKKDMFPVGEKVVVFNSKKSTKKESKIILPNKKELIFNNILKRLPVENDGEVVLSIFNKIERYPHKNEYVCDFNRDSNQTTPNRLISQGLVSETKDDTFKYKLLHSASKTLYSKVIKSKYSKNNESTYGKLKVVLNYSGGFVGEKYMFLSRDLIGKQMFGILVENEEIGKNIIDIYSSKLFNWYISCEKNGGFNSGIYKLPKIDFTKKYTDEDLYDIFKLSDLEKDYIRNYDI